MILLDTHVWLWWINLDTAKLADERRQQIEAADKVGVCVISCFEVAWLERHSRLTLPCDCRTWFNKALDGSGVTLMPITPEIAWQAVHLPPHHRDPHDRLIIATALVEGANLMSFDTQFPMYQELSGLLLA